MAEKTKTLDDITKEYAEGCTKAGHLQYQIHVLSKDLEVLNGVLRDLNFEAAKLKTIEPEGNK
jgi:hypothetical protein